MRGADRQTGAMFSYLSPEAMVPAGHPLRLIRPIVNAALERLSRDFDKLYASGGRDSIAPEKLLRALLLQGDLPGALRAFQAGMAIRTRLAERDPGNTQWQRDLTFSHNRIGDVLRAEGNLPGALRAYQAGMEISTRLAERDPSNTQWQRDLSGSHERIGDMLGAHG